jgi:hypothetical protein
MLKRLETLSARHGKKLLMPSLSRRLQKDIKRPAKKLIRPPTLLRKVP